VEEPNRGRWCGSGNLMTRLSVPDTVGSRALAWLEKEYVRFDVFQDLVAGHPNEARQTAVCELAFALLVLSRDRRLLRDDRVSRLADCLFHIYRNPSFHSYIFDGHPLAFTGHLITWLAVETLKCPVPIPRERIQELAVTDRIVSAQRPAFRTMDVVFYLTDFGRRVPTFPDTAGVRRIGDWLSACLEMLTEFHHWDLVAEVLLSLQCLRAEAVEDQKRAWQALYEAQDPTGAILEGPSGESVQPASVDLVPSEFLALYHRSLVAVLAGFVARGEEML
jgi:hypothetical protein